MKKYFCGMLIAATLTSAQAFDVKDWNYVNQLNWLTIEKISKVEAYKVGNSEILYFYHLNNGREGWNTVDSTANPVMYSLIHTAYLTGASVEIKRGVGKEGSELMAVRLKN